VYEFHADRASTYLGPNLEPSNAVQAAFVNSDAGITVMPVNGALPAFAGAEANLLGGVGFGTYANPDYRADVDWTTAGPFRSVVTADVAFTSSGDSVLLCRSFATTCVELIADGAGTGINLAIVRVAANAPDTDIGEISTGVSAAIRGTGDSGLTIALTDPTPGVVGLPFLASAGTPFEVQWTVERGEAPGSLDWSVAIDGSVIGEGNTAADLATSIVKTGGVALVFDTPLGEGNAGGSDLGMDYSYVYEAPWDTLAPDPSRFADPFGAGVALSPQPNLGFAPLLVYPTEDPGHDVSVYSGNAGEPHAPAAEEGVVGMITAPPGTSGQHFVYSVAFDGDDFDGIPGLDNVVDWGGTGGGFYPSPAFGYAQIFPGLQASVEAGVQREVHRVMYARLANGVLQADASLPGLVAGLNADPPAGFGLDLVYTDLAFDDCITIGTDYADHNLATAITTSAEEGYEAVLTDPVSTTFRTQFNAVITALQSDAGGGDYIYEILIGAGAMTASWTRRGLPTSTTGRPSRSTLVSGTTATWRG
jgi:hypothetical protein